MNTYMQKTFDLSTYDFADVTFAYWRNSEKNRDFFRVKVNGQELWRQSGSIKRWRETTLDLSAYAGQSNVDIMFQFTSNRSKVPSGNAGVWLDDINLYVESFVPGGASQGNSLVSKNLRMPSLLPATAPLADLALSSLAAFATSDSGQAAGGSTGSGIPILSGPSDPFSQRNLAARTPNAAAFADLPATRLDSMLLIFPSKSTAKRTTVSGPVRSPAFMDREIARSTVEPRALDAAFADLVSPMR